MSNQVTGQPARPTYRCALRLTLCLMMAYGGLLAEVAGAQQAAPATGSMEGFWDYVETLTGRTRACSDTGSLVLTWSTVGLGGSTEHMGTCVQSGVSSDNSARRQVTSVSVSSGAITFETGSCDVIGKGFV